MKLSTYIKHLMLLQQAHGDLDVVRGHETARSRQHFDSGFQESPSPAIVPDIKGVVRQEDNWGKQEVLVHKSEKHDRKIVYIA